MTTSDQVGLLSQKKIKNLSVNAIEGMDVKGEDVRAMVCPMSSGATPKNWIATDIPTIFHLSQ